MSNPLLHPNDPRFQKPQLSSSAENPFADSLAKDIQNADAQNAYQPAASDEENRPYVPAYSAQQAPRIQLLVTLGALGWAAAVTGAIALTGIFDIGWLAPLLGLAPAASGWLLAHEDLRAIRVGAIDQNAAAPTRQAYWLGLTALIACTGVVASMIYRHMNFLPDVF